MPIISWFAERARFSARLAFRHVFASAAVALLAFLLVFVLWYPAPAADLLGVGRIFVVLLAADAVCGPLLTLVLASPAKRRHELVQDLCIVGFIQVGALVYGLIALESARPIAYVFEQDRLVVVAKNELYEADCKKQCMPISEGWGISWRIAAAGMQGNTDFHSLDLSLQGISPAMRRSAWQDWRWNDPKLQSVLRPLFALDDVRRKQVSDLRGGEYLSRPGLMFLPLVSTKSLGWMAIFDANGKWVDSLPVDAFDSTGSEPTPKSNEEVAKVH